jgi:putative hydrolase of the HAD superfamily
MIEAIIFDLGNVVVSLDFAPTLEKWSRLCGRGPEEVRAKMWAHPVMHSYETGRIDDQEFYRAVTAELGLALPFEEFAADWRDVFGPPLMEDSFFAGLAKNYALWALSDTCALHVTHLWPAYGPLRHFRGGVFSNDVGVMKPAEKMYRTVVERAGVAPEKCFYTDDRQTNVDGAKAVGLDAALFTSPPQLQSDLRLRGVSW